MRSFCWGIPSLTGQNFASWGINSPACLDYAHMDIVLVCGVSCFRNNRKAVEWEGGDLWYMHEVKCCWVVSG